MKLSTKGIDIYILSTLFVSKGTLYYDRINVLDIQKLNLDLENFCTKNNLNFIDLNSCLSKNNSLINQYTYDGCHLNGNGEIQLIKIIDKYI